MKTLNIHEAKTNLSAILKEIEENGERVVICRNGKPIADISAHRPVDRLKVHTELSNIQINYDTTEPLSEDEWPESAR